MAKLSKQTGDTLALVLVCIGLVSVLIAFFVLNYNQIMGTHAEVQNSIDASALVVAKDMSRIVVEGPLGRVALVDDAPAFTLPTGQVGGTTDPRPITSINTLMGTLRLDAIIGSQLVSSGSQNGNGAILYLVQNDLANAVATSQLLQTTLFAAATGGTAYDKYGQPVTMMQDAVNSYVQNNQRLGKSTQAPNLIITLGYLNPTQVTSNISVPQPAGVDPLTNGMQFYPPYQNIAATGSGPGANLNFQFVPLSGGQLALISSDLFQSTLPDGAASYVPPSVVQVSISATVNDLAQVKTGTQSKTAGSTVQSNSLREISTAECGGSPDMAFPSGALEMSFANAGGLPDKTASSVDFTSPTSIMNAYQANPTTGTAAASWNGPGQDEPQPWFHAVGGAVPADSGASLQAYQFKGLAGQMVTNPSVALSFGVYDWLRSLGIRPNVTSVVQALSLANLKNGFYDLQDRIVNGSYSTQPYTMPLSYSYDPGKLAQASDWIQPAYADNQPKKHGLTSAYLDISLGHPNSDRRNLTNWSRNPEAYRRQQSNVWGYVAADPVIPDQARLVQVVNGYVTTTDGNPAEVLNHIYAQLKVTTEVADQTQTNAWQIVQLRMNKILKDNPKMAMKQVTQQALQLEPRAFAALHNSSYCVYVMYTIGKNLKALTGLGADQISNSHYQLAGADFYPASHVASVDEIQSGNTIPTGQDNSAPGPKDWCAPLVNGKSQLDFYKHTAQPAIGNKHGSDIPWYEQPALAVTPPAGSQNVFDKLKFIFSVVGGTGAPSGTTGPGTGTIQLVVGQAPFAGESILPGQQLYQSVHALMVTSTTPPTTSTVQINNSPVTVTTPGTSTSTVYQVQARDENANAYPNLTADLSKSDTPAGYFADMNANGGAKTVGSGSSNWCQTSMASNSSYYPNCPALAFEWQLTCPIAQTTCLNCNDIVVPTPPVTFHPAINYTYNVLNSRTYAGQSGVSSSLIYEGCAQWDTNNGQAVYANSQTTYYDNSYTIMNHYTASYWTVGGLDFSTGALGNYIDSGNGWNVGTAPYQASWAVGSFVTQSAVTYSWTTTQWIWEPHS